MLLMLILAFLCWGKLLFLKGIWWDDWAWVWHYFGSANLSEFMEPFKSLRHEMDGYLFFLNMKLMDIIPEAATNIWNIWKFMIFFANSVILYAIAKNALKRESILPEAIAVIYLVSPIVNNLWTVELGRRIYLGIFFLSILLSVKSVSGKKFKISYYISSVLLAIVSMACLESFVFFDLARPFIIFYALYKKAGENISVSVKKTVIYWLPFVVVGAFVLLLKSNLLIPRSGSYGDTYSLFAFPAGKYLHTVIYNYARSLYYVLFGNAWHFIKELPTIQRHVIMLLSSLAAALLAMTVILKGISIDDNSQKSGDALNEAKWVTLFGMLLIMAGLFPYAMVRGYPCFGPASRHALLASVGVSVLIPSFLLSLHYKGLIKKTATYLLLGAVIFLGVFQCNRAIAAYSNDWQQQCSFWRQFTQMVPDIKDKTHLLVDMPREEKSYFGMWGEGIYEFGCPLNLLYAKTRDRSQLHKHFAMVLADAFNKNNSTFFYPKNKDREEVSFDSCMGIYKYYPKNLIIVSYRNGRLYLNKDRDRIIHENDGSTYPFRGILGCMAENRKSKE